MYNAKIILDSINPVGNRLTTFEITYPRFVHAELMTHLCELYQADKERS